MFVKLSYFFEHISSYEHFYAKRLYIDIIGPGKPSRTQSPVEVRARSLKSFILAPGVDKTASRGFSTRPFCFSCGRTQAGPPVNFFCFYTLYLFLITTTVCSAVYREDQV